MHSTFVVDDHEYDARRDPRARGKEVARIEAEELAIAKSWASPISNRYVFDP